MRRRSTGASRHCSGGNPVDPLGEMTSRVLGLPARGEDDVLDLFLPCATWAKAYDSHQSEGHTEKGSLVALDLLQAVLILFKLFEISFTAGLLSVVFLPFGWHSIPSLCCSELCLKIECSAGKVLHQLKFWKNK